MRQYNKVRWGTTEYECSKVEVQVAWSRGLVLERRAPMIELKEESSSITSLSSSRGRRKEESARPKEKRARRDRTSK